MRFLLLFLFCVAATAAHADCTPANDLVGTKSRVDWVEGGLVYDTTNDVLKTCDGTNWQTVGGGGGLSGGTSGYLGVWTSATTMGLSSTTAGQNLFWDATNNRLGIGTASPAASLHVVNSLGGVPRGIVSDQVGAGTGAALLTLRFATGTIGSLGPAPLAQNVGQIRFQSFGTTGYVSNAIVSAGTEENATDTSSAGFLTFQTTPSGSTSTVERVRIDASGNVGIGTTSPAQKLDVSTAMRVSATATKYSDLFPGFLRLQHTAASGDWAEIDLHAGAAVDSRVWNIAARGDTGSLMVRTFNDARSSNSEIITFLRNGNVGIGTTTPAAKLDVAGGVRIGDQTSCTNGTHNGTLKFASNALSVCTSSGWSTLGAGGSNADTLDGFSSEDFLRSGQLYGGDNVLSIYGTNVTDDVWSGGLELREVNAVNNTQTASSYAPALTFHWANLVGSAIKMYSDGSFRFRDQSTNSTGYRPIYAGSVVSSGNVSAAGNVVASGAFVHASADPYFVVDNNNKQLVLSGGSGWVNTGAAMVLRGAGTGTNTHGLEIYTGNAERVRILSNGNVGIGTAAPAAKLSIAINGAPSDPGNYGNAIQITNVSTGGQQLAFIRAGNKVRSFGYLPNSNVFGLGNGTVTDASFTPSLISVSNADQVGIGTATPSYTLHVEGTAYAAGAAGALSDMRHKKNITTLVDGALDKVLRLRPVSFEWKAPKDDGMRGQQFGFIAQEIEKVFPPLVLTQDNEEKTKGIKPTELIPVLTKAIQELKADNDNLRTELDELRSEIEAVKSAR